MIAPRPPTATGHTPTHGPLSVLIRFFLERKLVTFLVLAAIVLWGVAVAPFDWDLGGFPRAPVPVDAIPNLGENQQIVFTEWPGRSPQDVENQVTYPLTVSLLGVPGVKEVRSTSMFGASLIFLVFAEDIEFYWSRTRIIEKFNSLPPGLLPDDAHPALGPDATALGQVFWYRLEGHDPDGNTTGGWDLHELRTVQDWTVRHALLATEGISEVASIGGYVKEYQVDVDPHALRAHGVTLNQVEEAVRKCNLDIGARVTEINRVEYVLRGLGFIKHRKDIELATVRDGPDGLPIRVKDVANVGFGPAQRRGALTKTGAEAVGGVVVVREGYNPLRAIRNLKDKIDEIRPGLPERPVVDWERTDMATLGAFAADHGFDAFLPSGLNRESWLTWLRSNPRARWPEGVTLSRLDIVSFYDRTGLINETLATLNDALTQQMLVTLLVIVLMLMHLRTALIIGSMLPLSVLLCFILMKLVGIDSHLVSLAGIVIAIGTIVDMGIIFSENILRHLAEARPEEARIEVVHRGAVEVASAVLTAIATTIVSFLPVFAMTGAEGKMFIPLAYTKTFVLVASVFLAMTLVPATVHLLIAGPEGRRRRIRKALPVGLGVASVVAGAFSLVRGWTWAWLAATGLLVVVLYRLARSTPSGRRKRWGSLPVLNRIAPVAARYIAVVTTLMAVWCILTRVWEPLGPEPGYLRNLFFVGGLIGGLMAAFILLMRFYRLILGWVLSHKGAFFCLPLFVLLMGGSVWLGFDRMFGVVPAIANRIGVGETRVRSSRFWVWAVHAFPGLGREFMPPLDEGTFLWMPTTMPHASLGEVLDVMRQQNLAMASVPEVADVIGKLGRVESALDPAPISMIETIIHYKPEYKLDEAGRRIDFRFDRANGEFVRDADGNLIPDRRGRPYRQWRDHIRSPDDIWNEIVEKARLPGTTSAPKLQPIQTRLVMLQTGMRAPMGIKLRAPDLNTLDRMAVEIERHLRRAPGVRAETVNAERVVGKPYLEIVIDREALSRYGLNVVDVQRTIAAAVGGVTATTTVEGRERYPVRIRYPRELRNNLEALENILVASRNGMHIPLANVASIEYSRGPQMIRGEDTFLTAYITFGGQADLAELEVVEGAQDYLKTLVANGELVVPPGVSWRFAGSYEHQLRAMATLRVVLPVALGLIFLILYFQFKTVSMTLIVFSGIAVSWAGGFVMIWLYGQDWFLNFSVFDVNLRDLFNLHAINLSVAVWVGFLALFGIAVDDGVVMATYIRQRFEADKPSTRDEIRASVIEAGHRRLRPCLMTSATTLLALLPVLTAKGRGADLLMPMTLPAIGGMTLAIVTWFTVPALASFAREQYAKIEQKKESDKESM